ncbi:MAG: transposase [Rikenellaceae bacterium]
MKEDHFSNGQLKPAYNVQMSTEEEIITNYSIHQTPTDTTTYIEHTEQFNQMYGAYPQESIADAGYGSEENYEYAKEKDITPYVKFSYFHKEQTKSHKENIFNSANFYYDKEDDFFVCPMGKKMLRQGDVENVTRTGFVQTLTSYKAINCKGCSLRYKCHKAKGDRVIHVNHNLNKHKEVARNLLKSEKGIEHRGRRAAEVEQAFGNLKWNKKFKRFLLRGIKKLEIEFGLLVIAHNMSKYMVKMR